MQRIIQSICFNAMLLRFLTVSLLSCKGKCSKNKNRQIVKIIEFSNGTGNFNNNGNNSDPGNFNIFSNINFIKFE